MHGNGEMNVIGYAMALVLLVLVLPLLPFLVFVYLLGRLTGRTSQSDEMSRAG